MRALRRVARAYSDRYDRAPYTVAYGTCFVKGCIATSIAIATETEAQSSEQNLRRFVNYAAVFGGIYCGMGQHYLYNSLYPRILGASQSVGTASAKIAAECFVTNPFVAMPLYYVSKSLIEGEGSVLQGLLQYRRDAWQVFKEFCITWGPAHIVTFGIVPPQFRVAWVATVSVAWLSRMSYVSHREELEAQQEARLTAEREHGEVQQQAAQVVAAPEVS